MKIVSIKLFVGDCICRKIGLLKFRFENKYCKKDNTVLSLRLCYLFFVTSFFYNSIYNITMNDFDLR